ncbi:hypothetical protein F1737_08605 [Methanoplanus sp. FWC-SCC4]|uniref:SMODS and SLOG-associating 2TM effector domain-containing protein n=1 Tax=Methanochimaera problematica TaxID=2609417 RepID=A0AA97FG05_9EURY|nr:hypothetical protein F1737_08605 [Methanoplanus sp. FWC-SCC4]
MSGTKQPQILFPGPLPVSVSIGFIATEQSFDIEKVLKSVKTVFLKMEKILFNTPHTYRFILPFNPGPEHIILESLSKDPIWKKCNEPKVVLLKIPFRDDEIRMPFEGEISFDVEIVSEEGNSKKVSESHYEPVIERSSFVILTGEWEPETTKYRKGSVFDIARNYGRTVVAINPLMEETFEMPHDDRIFESYTQLNDYNSEYLSDYLFQKKALKYISALREECKNAGLSEDAISKIYSQLLPQFIRSRMLSEKYRMYYSIAGTFASILAAMAVLTITLQTLFFPEMPEIVWIEVAEIFLIILLMTGSRYGDFHRKWIDYSFLSERIRAAFFLCIVCITCEKPDTPPHMSLAHRPNDWMVMAFESLTESGKIEYCRLDIPFEPLKKFFASAWIGYKLKFYKERSRSSRKKFFYLAIAGETIFVLTLILAVIHAAGIGHWEIRNVEGSLMLAYLTITLPAVGSAIAAVRVQREYLRNSERYSHIVRHLTAIKNQTRHVRDMGELCGVLEEMNEITLREQQDWRIIFRFRRIEAM